MANSCVAAENVIERKGGEGAWPDLGLPWHERRALLYQHAKEAPIAGVSEEEVEVHFSKMPQHYWEHVTEPDLKWGLETIHGFLQTIAGSTVSPTTPYLNWRVNQEAGVARVMICTWDRHALLAKCAACFSALRLNILQAEVYTREDQAVLDVFQVFDSSGKSEINAQRMQELTFLLDGALSEPPRFASIWACSRHKFLTASKEPCRIVIDNEMEANVTTLRVEASDRLGLLHDILQAIAESGFNVAHAEVQTENGMARDTLHIIDSHGQKITRADQLESLRRILQESLVIPD